MFIYYSVKHDNKKGKQVSIKYIIKMLRCLKNPHYLGSPKDSAKTEFINKKYEQVLDGVLKESKDKDRENQKEDFEYINNNFIDKKYFKEIS